MKPALAKKLVANLMSWGDERATAEFAWMSLMVDYKFDHYQGYTAGNRFYIHLLSWLSSFKNAPDRECAFDLLRRKLTFISQREMHHLVSLSGPQINSQMRSAIARRLKVPVYQVEELDEAKKQLAILRERTLYVGVSDGAKIDVFRRYNEGAISNEQVVPMAEISTGKKESLCRKLQQRLKKIGADVEPTFEWVCLIDDFTGSGTSSIRVDSKGEWDGKVSKFIADSTKPGAAFIAEGAHVLVHHYLASHYAATQVSTLLDAFGKVQKNCEFIASFSHVLPKDIKIDATSQQDLENLLNRRYDPGIETTHTGPDIWLGYKQCGLPLILDHNAPNNSVATLWAQSDPESPKHIPANFMSPLFPRRQRHSDAH